MNFTLHQLQIFATIAELRSVTKAADTLHLTQPAVSIQLKNFQDQFNLPLFETVGRQLYITPFGQEVAQSAQGILEQIQLFNKINMNYKGELTGTLRIASVSTGKYVMPYFVSRFASTFPQVDIKIDVSNRTTVIDNLSKNEIDFALVSIDANKLSCEKLDLIENKLILVGHPKYISKNPKQNTLKELVKRAPFIFREEGSGTRLSMERFLDLKKIKISKKIELTSNEAVKQAIIAGMGISIMPLIGLKNELSNHQLHVFQSPGLPIKTKWKLIWLKGKRFSPAAKTFIEFLEKNKSEIISEHFNWIE